jgi:hypothetical protein
MLVGLAEALSDCIKVYDERIEKLATEKYMRIHRYCGR